MKKYKCDICGRELHKKNRIKGHILCSKHMHQFLKYGRVLDNIQRTNKDLNDYKINYKTKVATFNLYNQRNIKIAEFVIDLDDIELVKYHKWRLSHNHVITGQPAKKTQRNVAHIILDFNTKKSNMVCDHIDGNPLNNKRSNLRLITQSDNVKNQAINCKNTSGYKGVCFDRKRNKWASEIRCGKKRVHFKRSYKKEYAVYMRMIAEKKLFKEYARESEIKRMMDFTKNITENIKKELNKHVKSKLIKHNLWQ